MQRITLSDAITGLLNIVARFPNHKPESSSGTPGCQYFEREGHVLIPICLIGQYISDLGFLGALALGRNDSSELQSGNGEDAAPYQWAACTTDSGMWDSLREHGLDFDEDAKVFMRYAQAEQDGGENWDNAVKYALHQTLTDTVRHHPAFGALTRNFDMVVEVSRVNC